MSTFFLQALLGYSLRRTKLLEVISSVPPLKIFEYAWAFQAVLFLAVISLIVSVFVQIRAITIFSLHPVCMVICAYFIGQGVAVFRNRIIVESVSPIMQKSKRTKVRTIHYSIIFAAGVFLISGLLFIVTSRYFERKAILAKSLHAVVGSLAVVIICIQGFCGVQKVEDIESKQCLPGKSKYSFHGDLGLVLWDVICCSLVSGLSLLMPVTNTYLVVLTIFCCSWYSVHMQMKRKGPEGSQLLAFQETAPQAAQESHTEAGISISAIEEGSSSLLGSEVGFLGESESSHVT